MAVDMFLKLGTIKGESLDKTHKDSIDILAWSWGASQSGTMHSGSGGGAGKVNVQDMSITKYVDRSTPVIWSHICAGTHIGEVKLTVRKAGGKPLEMLTVTMKECIITSTSTGGSGGEDRLTENISLNFASFELSYTPQKPDGSGDAAIPMKWNIVTNAES